MLIWVCALHCEAKPVIDYYRLKKSHDDNAFDLYLGDDMACIISGIGKVACAAACAWIAARQAQQPSLAWINLGVAGAAEHSTGSLFSVTQVIDADTGQRFYPAPFGASKIAGSACETLSAPSDDYREDRLFDMEASGFMYSCLRFSSAELVQSLKVISDNRHEKTGNNRPQVSLLIQQQISAIDAQAQTLLQLNEEVAALVPASAEWQRLTAMARFTQTQKNRLRVLWRYLLNRNFDAEQLLQQHAGQTADGIIESLQQLSYQDSESL
jgi:adenosylhomocysteine nucleosidase